MRALQRIVIRIHAIRPASLISEHRDKMHAAYDACKGHCSEPQTVEGSPLDVFCGDTVHNDIIWGSGVL